MTPSPRWIDLTADDLRAVIESVESSTAFWSIKVTGAPGPQSGRGATRWAFLFWTGPPSDDLVPSVAITRHRKGYRITILDPLELFASGAFEVVDCGDLARTVETVREVIDEAREIALDRGRRDIGFGDGKAGWQTVKGEGRTLGTPGFDADRCSALVEGPAWNLKN